MKDYEEIIRQKGLPNVGRIVRCRKYGTFWRVIEKREVWQNVADHPLTKQPRMVPAIYLCFWRIQEGVPPGVGRMMGYTYTLLDNTFEARWEIISDYYLDNYSEGLLEEAQEPAEVTALPTPPQRQNRLAEYEEDREASAATGKVLPFRPTKKTIYRAAAREVQKMYQLSRGGIDPIIDDASREAFERGEIEEVRWKDWFTYLLHDF
jgi:hypothetical protein